MIYWSTDGIDRITINRTVMSDDKYRRTRSTILSSSCGRCAFAKIMVASRAARTSAALNLISRPNHGASIASFILNYVDIKSAPNRF